MTFVFDYDGNLLAQLDEPRIGIEDGIHDWTPHFFVDLDADGAEEIVAQLGYYESSIVYLYPSRNVTQPIILHEDGC